MKTKIIKAWAVRYWGLDESCVHKGEMCLFVTEDDAREAAKCNPLAHEVLEVALMWLGENPQPKKKKPTPPP